MSRSGRSKWTTAIPYLVAFCVSATPALAGKEPDSLARARNIRLSEAVLQTGERNYISIAPWKGDYRRLIFEGDIAPPYFLLSRRGPRLGRRLLRRPKVQGEDAGATERTHLPFLLVVVPKVVLRMLGEHSQPVFTPSFMPRLDLYWRLSAPASPSLADESELLDYPDYILLRASHHSNGQSGEGRLRDGTLNRDNGSWATNFIELGISRNLHPSLGDLLPWNKNANRSVDEQLSLELHPNPGAAGRDPETTQGYASTRLNYSSDAVLWESSERLPLDRNQLLLSVQLTAMAGHIQHRFHASRRIAYRGRLMFRPGGPGDTAFFGEYYSGQDFYNINFEHYLRRWSVGISIWPRSAIGALEKLWN